MNIYALELDNDLKGIPQRQSYIESLIAKTQQPDLIVLPELALCSYMGSDEIWQYADKDSALSSLWAKRTAEKFNTLIALGYLEKQGEDFYNSYMIAGANKVYGVVRKREGEAYVFKRGSFPSLIPTPMGKVAVGICYDARRRGLYDNIKDEELSLILFPHGAPGDPKKLMQEELAVETICRAYVEAFDVPVVYVNSRGRLDYMQGMTGAMMHKAGFALNGLTAIYASNGSPIECDISEAVGWQGELLPKRRCKDIKFYGKNLTKGNWVFRNLILKPDIREGIASYEKHKRSRKDTNIE